MPEDLKSLLWPLSPEEFFQTYYEQRLLHVEGRKEDYFRALFSKRDAELVLWQQESRVPRFIRYSKDGAELDPPRNLAGLGYGRWTLERYFEGWTIIFNALDECWLPIARLTRGLESLVGNSVYAVGFLTPPGSRGFLAHFDTPNVFVVQVEGTKLWRLYQSAVERPLLRQARPLDPAILGAPIAEIQLQPGELLYLPGGLVHSAEAQSEASLHITIGFHPRRRLDLLKTILAVAAESAGELRSAVPSHVGLNVVQQIVEELLPSVVRGLRDARTVEAALQRSNQELVSSLRPLPDTNLDSLNMAKALASDDLVEKRSGQLCVVGPGAEGRVGINFPGVGAIERDRFEHGAIEGPAVIEPALRFIAEATGPFRSSDLPGFLTTQSKLLLVRRLVREGLLRTVDRCPQR